LVLRSDLTFPPPAVRSTDYLTDTDSPRRYVAHLASSTQPPCSWTSRLVTTRLSPDWVVEGQASLEPTTLPPRFPRCRSSFKEMTSITAATIAAIYRDVLTDSIAAARAMALDDADMRRPIESDFSASIPTTVPVHLAAHIGKPELRELLRAGAAELLIRICERRPLPRGSFIDALASAATRLARSSTAQRPGKPRM
jgi:hypothetical protein